MHEERAMAGEKLTPFSVSVSGYYRQDGRYISPHSRRPPGSVKHDEPYIRKSDRLFSGMTALAILSLCSIGGLVIFSTQEIKNRKKNFLDFIENEVICKLSLDFSNLVNKPRHLINRLISRHQTLKRYNCKNCLREIKINEFHFSSMATRNPWKICIDCMRKDEKIYEKELEYIQFFNNRLVLFIEDFTKLNKLFYPKHKVESKQLEQYFYNSVKELRKKIT
jgi:hypothetical protein